MSRRFLLQGAGALAAGGLLTLGAARPTAARTGVMRLRLLADDGTQPGDLPGAPAALESLAQAYRAAAPDVRVDVVLTDGSVLVAAREMLAGDGPAADVLWVTPAVRNLPGTPDLLFNVGPVLGDVGLRGGVYPSLLAYGQSAGRQVLAPLFRDPLVVYYSVDAFSRAGVSSPPGAWTLRRFITVCRQIAESPFAAPGYALANALATLDPELLAVFVAGFGGQVLPLNPPSAGQGLLSPQAQSGIAALLSLLPFAAPPGPQSAAHRFATGNAAMYVGHQHDMAYLAGAIGDLFAWNVASLPRFPVRAAVAVQAFSLGVTSRNPRARPYAEALALFGLTQQAQRALASAGAGVPALSALAESPDWRRAMPAVNLEAFVTDPQADIVVPSVLYHLSEVEAAFGHAVAGTPPAVAFAPAARAISVLPWWRGF